MRTSKLDDIPSELTKCIYDEFESLKNDVKVWGDYMDSLQRDAMIREEGKAEGKIEGMDLMIKVNKLMKENMSKADIAQKCEISEKEVDEILNKLKELN